MRAGGGRDGSHAGGLLRANGQDQVHTRPDPTQSQVQGVRSRCQHYHQAGRREGRLSGLF